MFYLEPETAFYDALSKLQEASRGAAYEAYQAHLHAFLHNISSSEDLEKLLAILPGRPVLRSEEEGIKLACQRALAKYKARVKNTDQGLAVSIFSTEADPSGVDFLAQCLLLDEWRVRLRQYLRSPSTSFESNSLAKCILSELFAIPEGFNCLNFEKCNVDKVLDDLLNESRSVWSRYPQ